MSVVLRCYSSVVYCVRRAGHFGFALARHFRTVAGAAEKDAFQVFGRNVARRRQDLPARYAVLADQTSSRTLVADSRRYNA